MLIRVVLNSQSDNPNILAISESVSDASSLFKLGFLSFSIACLILDMMYYVKGTAINSPSVMWW